jgi:hypothetical protein
MKKIQYVYQIGWGLIILLMITALSASNVSAQSFNRIYAGDVVGNLGGFMGSAWGDYDNDGYEDLFVADYLAGNPNLLLHNDGNSDFTRIRVGRIANDLSSSNSGSWGDYDNDGDLDMFVANSSGGNFLYRNEGGEFTRILQGAIVDNKAVSLSGSWGDYDNDGYLDLFVANDGAKNFLFRNNGDATFTRITDGAIVNDVASSVVGLWADYDNDGDLDLLVVNGFFSKQKNAMYRNDGNGNFAKITSGAVVEDVEGSTGGSWGDYDNDGDLDLYICNSVDNAKNSLYKNKGEGTFVKVTKGLMVTELGHSVGSSWADYDNDGDLDLFVINVFAAKNQLYRNDGNDVFTKITSGAIVTDYSFSFGCSWADYDNDGDQDVFVTNGGINSERFNFFYQNQTSTNNWLKVHCLGTLSNSSAIGTIVKAKATIAGKSFWQTRQISGQTGFLSQNSLIAAFGLKNAPVVDSLIIKWPSGGQQILTNVAPNQLLKIKEQSTTSVANEAVADAPVTYHLAANYPNPFNPETTIEYELGESGRVRLEIYNMLGQKIKTLVDQQQESGVHRVVWQGRDEMNATVASGIYFYRIQSGDFRATRQMVLLR